VLFELIHLAIHRRMIGVSVSTGAASGLNARQTRATCHPSAR
jgi:hypothetical protein